MRVATEVDIRRHATRLYEAAAATTPRLFDRKWWTGRLLDWAIRDETFKVQLFRFIDVLPTLKTPSQIKRLVDEYFGQDAGLQDAPGGRSLMRWGMRALSTVGFGVGVTADTIYNQAVQMANQFIVGAGTKEALPVVADLWKRGMAHSVDLLGEATVCEAEAETYAARYHEAITALAEAAGEWRPSPLLEADHLGPLPRTQVSIKLSALYSQFDRIDPEGCSPSVAARLRPLLRAAVQRGAAITFDMEHYEWKDLTIGIVRQLLMEDEFRAYPFASLALQAYLRDTAGDVRDLLAWAEARGTPMGVRLVKGAYWDYETIMHRQRGWPVPVFARKDDTDASYEQLIPLLLEHHAVIRPAFGTHNLRHVAMVMAEAERRGLAANVVELQMLYGMAEPLQAAVVDAGYRVRVYAPVGDLIPGMAYLVRRLLENTANESILRRQFLGKQSLDELLKPSAVESAPLSPTLSSTRCNEEATGALGRGKGEGEPEFTNEPHTDFARAEARKRMRAALATVRTTLGRRIDPAFPVPRGLTRPTLTPRNPAKPEEVVGVVSAAVPQDVDEAVARAVASGRSWAATSAADRIGVVAKDAVLQFLPGEPEAGRRLVGHPDVPVIAFTGSKAVGLQIIAAAAQVPPGQREVKKVVAEMGGKNAIIVDDTADLDEAVAGVSASFLGYQGQKCSACSRAIVLDAIHDAFVERLVEAARSVRMGPPEEPGTGLGPLIDQRAVQKVLEYLALAQQEGTPALLPDPARRSGPNFVGPAVVTNIRPEHRLAREEIFGPVLAVLRARDFDEALAFANSTEYALTGGLFSRSPRNIARAREEFLVGNLYINRGITGALVGRQPFGGGRLSGIGAKAGGPDYLLQFVSSSVISENTLRRGFSPDCS